MFKNANLGFRMFNGLTNLAQDGVYDVSAWEENDKMSSANNLDINDSVRSGQPSVTSNTFSTPSTASLQVGIKYSYG